MKISNQMLIATIFFLLVGFLVMGGVVSVLWNWFIVPVFNAPPLTMIAGAGLVMLIRYPLKSGDFVEGYPGEDEVTLNIVWRSFIMEFLVPAVYTLMLGFFVYGFFVLTYRV